MEKRKKVPFASVPAFFQTVYNDDFPDGSAAAALAAAVAALAAAAAAPGGSARGRHCSPATGTQREANANRTG